MSKPPRDIPIHYRKRFFAGSPLNTEKPPESPERSPLEQARAEADMICEILTRRKGRANPASAREQYDLTRREIADLLQQPGVASALTPAEQKRYLRLASGNASETEIAVEIAQEIAEQMQSAEEDLGGIEAAVKEDIEQYIRELETKIIRRYLLLDGRLEQKAPVETDTYDRTLAEDRAADERDIAKTGGAAIGGSVIAGEKRFGNKPGTTFRPGKGITSFEKGGKIRTVSGGEPDRDDRGGETSESDDYSEDSSA